MKKLLLLIVASCNTSQMLYTVVTQQDALNFEQALNTWAADKSSQSKFQDMLNKYGILKQATQGARSVYQIKARNQAAGYGVNLDSPANPFAQTSAPAATAAPTPLAPTALPIATSLTTPEEPEFTTFTSDEPENLSSAERKQLRAIKQEVVRIETILPGDLATVQKAYSDVLNKLDTFVATLAPSKSQARVKIIQDDLKTIYDAIQIKAASVTSSSGTPPPVPPRPTKPALPPRPTKTAVTSTPTDDISYLNNIKTEVPENFTKEERRKLFEIESTIKNIDQNLFTWTLNELQDKYAQAVKKFNEFKGSLTPKKQTQLRVSNIQTHLITKLATEISERKLKEATNNQNQTVVQPVPTKPYTQATAQALQEVDQAFDAIGNYFGAGDNRDTSKFSHIQKLFESAFKKYYEIENDLNATDRTKFTNLIKGYDEKIKNEAAVTTIPQAPPLTETFAPKNANLLPTKGIKPSLNPVKPGINAAEWDRLKELDKLADRNLLIAGSDGTEKEFEHLVDRINQEVQSGRVHPTSEQQEILDAALTSWDLLRAQRS